MNIRKIYNPTTEEYEFNKFHIVHSMVGGSLTGGDDLSEYQFHDGQTPPTEAEVKTEKDRLVAEYDAQEYARDRATSYPSVGDQLDMLMKDMKNGTTTHQTACEAVKAKYPKPE